MVSRGSIMVESRESASLPKDEARPSKVKHRYSRTRSGCQRCRAQRRKCDERKPRCDRCLNANVACTYATHLSFKPKNSRILSNAFGSTLNGTSEHVNTYPAIEFITFDHGTSGTKATDHSPSSSCGERLVNHDPPVSTFQDHASLESAEGWPLVGRSPLSSAEAELLKYYNHHIAPWLDVYDEGRTFGRHVTRLAMTSPCVLELLLQVSAVFSNRPIETVTRRGAGLFHFQAMSNPSDLESPSAALQSISCFVLARTLLFVDKVPDSWEPSFEGSGAFRYFRRFDFSNTIQQQIWFAFLTLILRLEIAYCLVYQRAPVWIPELAQQIEARLDAKPIGEEKDHQVLHASLRCLVLLVHVMQLCITPPEAEQHITASSMNTSTRVQKWKDISKGLSEWYHNRPPNFEPLVDVASSGDAFPTVIFTDGASIASNTLYHTAMLLLLTSKSNLSAFEKNNKEDNTDVTQSSPEWHAHRICGIAISSEPEYARSWGPETIAAFSLAAQHAKHSSQQNDILKCFGQLKAGGWHIDGLADKVRSQWKSVGRYASD
ncbi:hypothetical protein F5B22DRAFT_601550 [Xylaria bambusicola]|uniref:uncharacterized protein n=1 Tax=Xylaria bambusicola TaxID=326684 RepID=UPI0020086708|nr:uncharacterized protein F5B22DRAFT_601550 [Xylaria bambusicola]KAI0518059.1 hypothetical protein F5B22DRAFT_601550 [Xylaria bambusicola]